MKIELIVPAAPDGGRASPLSNRVASLREKVIGLFDNDWSSYGLFLNKMELLLENQAIKISKRIPNLPRRGLMPKAELDALAGQIDTAIVGLGA